MKRHKVDPANLPTDEVLAIGYQNEMLVGWLYEDRGKIYCEAESELLEAVTHYILKSDLLNLPEE